MEKKLEKLPHSRFAAARRWLIFWTLFIGLGAVGGAAAMLIDPTGKALGMDAMLPYFQVLPFADAVFQDFVFSGVALLIVNGLTNLTAAVLLLAGCLLAAVFHWGLWPLLLATALLGKFATGRLQEQKLVANRASGLYNRETTNFGGKP